MISSGASVVGRPAPGRCLERRTMTPEDRKTVQTRLLLIDPDETHLRWLARVIQTGIANVEVCSRTSIAPDVGPYDLVVMSYDVLDTEVSAKQIMGVRRDHPEVPFLL